MKCCWNPENTPAELYSMLRTLAEEYPVAENPAEANLRFVKTDDPETLSVKRDGNTWIITYGRTAFAARGLAYVMAELECDETIAFKTYGDPHRIRDRSHRGCGTLAAGGSGCDRLYCQGRGRRHSRCYIYRACD